MKSRWRKRALGDLLEVVIDYRGKTPRKMGGDWSDEGYRVLSAKHVKDGEIVKEEEIRRVSQDVYERWMQIEVEPGDIILTSEAPFGEALYWDRDEKVVLGQRLSVRIPNLSMVDSYTTP
jgi:type I restriction enzyme S subunit